MQTDAPLGVSTPAATTAARPRAGFAGWPTGALLLTGGLTLLAIVWLLPIVWIILTALKPEPEIIRLPIRWLPEQWTLANVAASLTTGRTANVAVAFVNSLIVAILETVLTLAIDAMAAYALARLAFRGRSIVFAAVVASIMVPTQITLVPLYAMFQQIGWLSSYQALVLPGLSRAFGVFLLRQFFLSVPKELEDAARIDGAGVFTIFYRIALPLVQPAMASLAIFTFLRSWNEFTWPLIVISRNDMMTLPVALARLLFAYRVEYGIVMAAAAFSAIPLIVVFFIFQRQIVQGIALTGLKE
ncbi:MAG: carbohydrate ABC transporter permease [Chloroflexi bacterium]|nr:carbohydrate ABC transporter permease [Chloroflexota bacterium]